jgi:hypothetical protein
VPATLIDEHLSTWDVRSQPGDPEPRANVVRAGRRLNCRCLDDRPAVAAPQAEVM